MGLDICVYKPVIAGIEENVEVFTIEENPELIFFKEFIFEKENDYYDLKGGLDKLGHNIDDLDWCGTEYGEKTTFNYTNTKHELYDAYTFLDSVWHRLYFSTIEELFESPEYTKYLEYLPILKKYGHIPEYEFFASGDGITYFNLNSAWNFSKEQISVKLIDPVTITKIDKCVSCIEVGYQRKGANKKFYENDIWSSPCIILKEELLNHWENYFSYQTPESIGGFGSGVEHQLDDDEMKSNFKENIIDKFIKNETFVMYC